ncbi:hypothetical protein ACFX16_032715 [Malus domestica]
MGEKDGKEGHSPVCRTPYDKKLLEWQHLVSFQVNLGLQPPHNLTIFMLAELSAMATSPITASPITSTNHPSPENSKTLAAYFTTLLAWAVVCYWYQSSRGIDGLVAEVMGGDVAMAEDPTSMKMVRQSNGFKDHCIDRMEQSARRNFMHSFASKRPRVPTFLAELRALVLTSPSVCLLNG